MAPVYGSFAPGCCLVYACQRGKLGLCEHKVPSSLRDHYSWGAGHADKEQVNHMTGVHKLRCAKRSGLGSYKTSESKGAILNTHL